MSTQLPAEEFERRLEAVRGRLAETDAGAGVWFGATSIEYLTGFDHIQTERPVVLAVTDERVAITVPRLEVERVESNPRIDAVYHYRDYPGGKSIETAVEMLEELGVDAVAADADGAPGVMGYQGPVLSEFVDLESQGWVARLRWEKSEAELELIRESAKWANLGHRYLAEYTEPGAHPATVSQRASLEASRAMLDTLGDQYVARTRGDGPVHAGYITGEQTRLPHGHTANRRLEAGDVLVTGASANVDGYFSELERTMFVGEPDDEQVNYFEIMAEAQDIAIDELGPGVPIAAVDRAVEAYFEEQGVADLAQHHVGHNIGMGGHEPPYIDEGWGDHCESEHTNYDEDDAVMQPGHVWTIEPGIYTDTYGYRHSDTIAVTEDGIEWLTYYPRDLESNIVSLE
ncbi:M24 family metallopeptidase [Natronobacterium gregoryi]|uniref:Aminopeptidase P family protein n=2 Tax=Natronobacterium gregoryi TaxID=44930 RepID=L0AJB5_NATGS|nr:Xaa-Pro peptidase family protein [Natronobacterium gregoryi]AFZ73901.1 Xaa-Pro aminopeptidase [Natronobacterium gregoryi SP2]ELY64858.1 xaa-pro aminopeptidase [Natronobacterium gregoryi SP2]PLK19162.1 aminopeptidase P family protein [Natronobacterium gregoryi SP2]SFJ59758.1 Xaa-Pro aminopeptidase [Natronobacterium gregoryi]